MQPIRCPKCNGQLEAMTDRAAAICRPCLSGWGYYSLSTGIGVDRPAVLTVEEIDRLTGPTSQPSPVPFRGA